MDRERITGSLRDFFASRRDSIACVYLFGSVARDEPHAQDVDVAVLCTERPPSTLENPCFAMASELEAELSRPVDVIDLHRASPDLVHRILRDGQLIADHDPSRRIAFEVKLRNEYFDLEPIRREYRRLGRAKP